MLWLVQVCSGSRTLWCRKDFSHKRIKGHIWTKTKLPMNREECLCCLNRTLWNSQVTGRAFSTSLASSRNTNKDDWKSKSVTPAFPGAPLSWCHSRAPSQELCTQQGQVHHNSTEAWILFPPFIFSSKIHFFTALIASIVLEAEPL